jgi:hypothetical protein
MKGSMAAALKCTTVTHTVVKWYDLEEFFQEVFGQEFSFSADQEAGNDTEHAFNVTGELDASEQKSVENFKATGRGSGLCGELLNFAVSQGLIQPGNYLITINY